MQYHVDFTSFEEYKEELTKKIDLFRSELDKVSNTHQKLEWQGDAFNTATNIFYNKMYDLYIIPQILELYVKFIDMALVDYRDGMEEVKKSFEEILEKIRAAKMKRGEIVDEL
jgi:uncharacterized coiled-coil DUF342 family protein